MWAYGGYSLISFQDLTAFRPFWTQGLATLLFSNQDLAAYHGVGEALFQEAVNFFGQPYNSVWHIFQSFVNSVDFSIFFTL